MAIASKTIKSASLTASGKGKFTIYARISQNVLPIPHEELKQSEIERMKQHPWKNWKVKFAILNTLDQESTESNIKKLINKITFQLHESFENNKITFKNLPFLIKERGYGSFTMFIDICLKPKLFESFKSDKQVYKELIYQRITYTLELDWISQNDNSWSCKDAYINLNNPGPKFHKLLLESGIKFKVEPIEEKVKKRKKKAVNKFIDNGESSSFDENCSDGSCDKIDTVESQEGTTFEVDSTLVGESEKESIEEQTMPKFNLPEDDNKLIKTKEKKAKKKKKSHKLKKSKSDESQGQKELNTNPSKSNYKPAVTNPPQLQPKIPKIKTKLLKTLSTNQNLIIKPDKKKRKSDIFYNKKTDSNIDNDSATPKKKLKISNYVLNDNSDLVSDKKKVEKVNKDEQKVPKLKIFTKISNGQISRTSSPSIPIVTEPKPKIDVPIVQKPDTKSKEDKKLKKKTKRNKTWNEFSEEKRENLLDNIFERIEGAPEKMNEIAKMFTKLDYDYEMTFKKNNKEEEFIVELCDNNNQTTEQLKHSIAQLEKLKSLQESGNATGQVGFNLDNLQGYEIYKFCQMFGLEFK